MPSWFVKLFESLGDSWIHISSSIHSNFQLHIDKESMFHGFISSTMTTKIISWALLKSKLWSINDRWIYKLIINFFLRICKRCVYLCIKKKNNSFLQHEPLTGWWSTNLEDYTNKLAVERERDPNVVTKPPNRAQQAPACAGALVDVVVVVVVHESPPEPVPLPHPLRGSLAGDTWFSSLVSSCIIHLLYIAASDGFNFSCVHSPSASSRVTLKCVRWACIRYHLWALDLEEFSRAL
jgi:hypothetical protein